VKTRIEELCNRHIAGITIPRNLTEQPITPEEILDCLLLTAALDRKHAGQIKQAMEAMAFCTPDIADIAKRNLAELRRLPEILRDSPTLLTDYVDLEDRLPEMKAACQALRTMAAVNPAQAEYLNSAATILEDSWTPLNPD